MNHQSPVPPPVPPPFGDPAQNRQGNSKAVTKGILIGCGGCAGLVVLTLLLGGSIFFFIFSSVRTTEPFQQTLKAAQESSALREALGEPITLGWWFSGSVNWNNGAGTADVRIPLNGPKGSVTVHTIGSKEPSGPWVFSKMQTTGDPVIDLRP